MAFSEVLPLAEGTTLTTGAGAGGSAISITGASTLLVETFPDTFAFSSAMGI